MHTFNLLVYLLVNDNNQFFSSFFRGGYWFLPQNCFYDCFYDHFSMPRSFYDRFYDSFYDHFSVFRRFFILGSFFSSFSVFNNSGFQHLAPLFAKCKCVGKMYEITV